MKKLALVTGANRGIGFETAKQLASQNIKVLLGVRNEDRGREAENKLKSSNLDVEYIHLDVDDTKTHEAAVKLIQEKYGKLDILINNAGIFIDEMENEQLVQASKTAIL